MKPNFLKFIFVTFIFITPLLAQEDIQIGSLKLDQRQVTGLFDFSDPSGINIKVQVWGYVRFPGYYIVPARSSLNDVMSVAGGPLEDALLQDIRILRTNLDSTTTLLKYDYNDMLWGYDISEPVKFPRLSAGDMIIIPGEKRYFVREDISFYLSIVYTVSTIALLFLTIANYHR
jgi:hypothetical protein